MKIIHLIESGGIYGAETVLLNLMYEQEKCGLSPVLFSIANPKANETPLEKGAESLSLEVQKIRIKKGINLLSSYRIIKISKEQSAEIIHCHGYKANILMGLLPAAIRKIPIISTLHGWTTTNFFSKKMCIELLDAMMLKKANRCIVVAKEMMDHPLIKAFMIKPRVVNNGIPKIDFNGVSAKQINPQLFDLLKNNFIIGSIGRLSSEKGFDILIKAFSFCKKNGLDSKLFIIGEGDERKKLEYLISKSDLEDAAILAGFIKNASQFLPLFDIFVLPSYTEGLPLTLLEAMQAGVPCIATKVGGVEQVLDYGNFGLLIEPGSVKELTTAISTLYNSNISRLQISKRAQQHVLMKYSVEKMAKDYLTIYNELISDKLR